jgi:hypothetical protein
MDEVCRSSTRQPKSELKHQRMNAFQRNTILSRRGPNGDAGHCRTSQTASRGPDFEAGGHHTNLILRGGHNDGPQSARIGDLVSQLPEIRGNVS